ncbi:hypothetical protein [Sporosarcina sp. A2]
MLISYYAYPLHWIQRKLVDVIHEHESPGLAPPVQSLLAANSVTTASSL